jgi:hypothetical protein
MPHISAKSETRIASSGLPDFGMSMCIAALKLQQPAEALACVNILAGADRNVHRMPNTYHLLRAVQPHWSHIGFDMLHRIGKLDHVPRVVAPVQFHREISVRTDF